MRTLRLFPFVLALFAPLFMASQCTSPSTSTTTFRTLQAAAAGIDSFRASYEAAAVSGQISAAQKAKCDTQFNVANEAIIATARAARDGMNATTTEEVNQAVASFIGLVTTLVPPKPRN